MAKNPLMSWAPQPTAPLNPEPLSPEPLVAAPAGQLSQSPKPLTPDVATPKAPSEKRPRPAKRPQPESQTRPAKARKKTTQPSQGLFDPPLATKAELDRQGFLDWLNPTPGPQLAGSRRSLADKPLRRSPLSAQNLVTNEAETEPEPAREPWLEFILPQPQANAAQSPQPRDPQAKALSEKAVASQAETPETEAPETEAPKTEAPETVAPKTEAPKTEAPETETPETVAPKTETPETVAPETEAPETEAGFLKEWPLEDLPTGTPLTPGDQERSLNPDFPERDRLTQDFLERDRLTQDFPERDRLAQKSPERNFLTQEIYAQDILTQGFSTQGFSTQAISTQGVSTQAISTQGVSTQGFSTPDPKEPSSLAPDPSRLARADQPLRDSARENQNALSSGPHLSRPEARATLRPILKEDLLTLEPDPDQGQQASASPAVPDFPQPVVSDLGSPWSSGSPISGQLRPKLSTHPTDRQTGLYPPTRALYAAWPLNPRVPPTPTPRPGSAGAGSPLSVASEEEPHAAENLENNPAQEEMDELAEPARPQPTGPPSPGTPSLKRPSPQTLAPGLEPDELGTPTLTSLALSWLLQQSQKMTRLVLGLSLTLALTLVVNGFLLLQKTPPIYLSVAPDLRVAPVNLSTEPPLARANLVNWASRVISQALSLDYLNWRQTLENLRESFSPEGYAEFVASLERSGHIKRIETEKLLLSCELTGAPVILATRGQGEDLTWTLEAPLVISFQNSQGIATSQKFLAEVVAHRVPTSRRPQGVEIQRLALVKNGGD